MGFWSAITGSRDLPEDGLGQGMLTDLRWMLRVRALRRQPVRWDIPGEADRKAWRAHPDVARFGDSMLGVADVEGKRCWLLDRDWHGWPDPPAFALFAFRRDGALWAAADFAEWPSMWTRAEPAHGAGDG